jgi:KUP system potassium uptake protein
VRRKRACVQKFRELAELEHMSGSSHHLPGGDELLARRSTRQKIKRFLWLSLASLGVIYGDIGTSPLYALSTALTQMAPDECTASGSTSCDWPTQQEDTLGILSLLLWALTLVVTIQYICVILALDHNGEGGHMALAAQITAHERTPRWIKQTALYIALAGTGFVIGDGCLTPAISVVSAIEGIAVYSASLTPYIVPISCIILIGLFFSQQFGTHRIGFLFGPIMLVWFFSLGALGIYNLATGEGSLAGSAWNPYWVCVCCCVRVFVCVRDCVTRRLPHSWHVVSVCRR